MTPRAVGSSRRSSRTRKITRPISRTSSPPSVLHRRPAPERATRARSFAAFRSCVPRGLDDAEVDELGQPSLAERIDVRGQGPREVLLVLDAAAVVDEA